MDGRALDELKALEAREAELGNRAERLQEADDAIAATRARAEEIAAFFASYDTEKERRLAEITAAAAGVHRREADVATAEQEVAAARDDESRGHAERAVGRASDHLSVAMLRLEHAQGDLEGLELIERELEQELPALRSRATSISRNDDMPAPGSSLQDIVDWAARAHSELFVAAAQLTGQREQVIREGNELASMLLGDPTYGLTVVQALRQVEAAKRSSSHAPGVDHSGAD